MSMSNCKHNTIAIAWNPETGAELSRRCSSTFGCGEQLSLGESDEAPVAMEIRAAELSNLAESNADHMESSGWCAHAKREAEPLDDLRWMAGFLSREIDSHGDRETRDADAWPWDVERPVARQFEEWVAKGDLIIDADGDLIVIDADGNPIPPDPDPDLQDAAARYLASDEGKAYADLKAQVQKLAPGHVPTDAERADFAYGNSKLSNEDVTHGMTDEAAMARERRMLGGSGAIDPEDYTDVVAVDRTTTWFAEPIANLGQREPHVSPDLLAEPCAGCEIQFMCLLDEDASQCSKTVEFDLIAGPEPELGVEVEIEVDQMAMEFVDGVHPAGSM